MLVEFSVHNYRSIYKRITLSMEAASKNELDEHTLEQSNIRLLKTSVIYGANASGKSNLLKALNFMKVLVMNSSKESQAGEDIKTEPFLLNSNGINEPTEMEIVFLIEDTLYRYGFAVNTKEVLHEWLITRNTKPKSRDIVLFDRSQSIIITHKDFKEGKDKVQSLLRENSLFLSLLAQFNGEVSSMIVKFFLGINVWNLNSFMPLNTSQMISDNNAPIDWISGFISKADMGIKSFKVNEEEIADGVMKLPTSYRLEIKNNKNKLYSLLINTEHEYLDASDNKKKTIWFDMATQESEGTKKFFSLAGILYQTLQSGNRLFIDEIENSLHPYLTRIIIRLFQDEETNPKGAQLIFTTHDTNHLDKERFRRDEIWFTEKDTQNSTDLYSLVEYKLPTGKARKDASYYKDYIKGKYGAVPYAKYSDFVALFKRNKH